MHEQVMGQTLVSLLLYSSPKNHAISLIPAITRDEQSTDNSKPAINETASLNNYTWK